MLDIKKLIGHILRQIDYSTFHGAPGGTALADKSLSSSTGWQQIGSITFPQGVWHVQVAVSFTANATGRRMITLSQNTSSAGSLVFTATSQAVNGYLTVLHLDGYLSVASGTATYNILAVQNSGSALTVAPRYTAHRVSRHYETI